VAARAYQQYRKTGGTRTSPLPDFYIGAHAEAAGYSLLTRDVPRYRTYFPTVPLIVPPGF
jgi:predicted nucleic acid-binding protein